MNKIIVTLLATASMAFAGEAPTPPKHPFDADGDKVLTKEEWMSRAAARFDAMDKNKDGKISREEREEGFKHLREDFRERLDDRRDDRRDDLKDRLNDRREDLKDRREERKEDVKDRLDDRKDAREDRRDDRREDHKEGHKEHKAR